MTSDNEQREAEDRTRRDALWKQIADAVSTGGSMRPTGYASVREAVEEAATLEKLVNQRHLEKTGRHHYSAVQFKAMAASICLYLEVGAPGRGVAAVRECLARPEILACKLEYAGSRYERHMTHLVSAGLECCVEEGSPASLEAGLELMRLSVDHVRQTAWVPHMSLAFAKLHLATGDERLGRAWLTRACAADPSLKRGLGADLGLSALVASPSFPPTLGFDTLDTEEIARLAGAGALRPASLHEQMDIRKNWVRATVLGWFDLNGTAMCAYQFGARGRFHLGALRFIKGGDPSALSPGVVFGMYHWSPDPRAHLPDLKGRLEAFWIASCDTSFAAEDAHRVEAECALWQPAKAHSEGSTKPGRFEPAPRGPTDAPTALVCLEIGIVVADRGGHAWVREGERWTPIDPHRGWAGRLIQVSSTDLLSLTPQGTYAWHGTGWRPCSWSVPLDAAVCASQHTVYAFGGTTPLESAYTDGDPPIDDAWRMNLTSTTEEARTTLPSLPSIRSSSTALALGNGDILVAGGTSDRWGNRAPDGDALYEGATKSWRSLPRATEKYGTPRLYACGSKRVVSIGADGSGRVFGWDTARRMWFVLGNAGIDLRESATAPLGDGQVLICGGRRRKWPHSGAWLVAPERHRGLLELPPMEKPRRGHLAVATSDGRVLVLGGGSAEAEYYVPAA